MALGHRVLSGGIQQVVVAELVHAVVVSVDHQYSVQQWQTFFILQNINLDLFFKQPGTFVMLRDPPVIVSVPELYVYN